MYKKLICLMLSFSLIHIAPLAQAKEADGQHGKAENLLAEKQSIYLKTSAVTGVPWTLIAACDHFEKLMHLRRHDLPKMPDTNTGIAYSENEWTGLSESR